MQFFRKIISLKTVFNLEVNDELRKFVEDRILPPGERSKILKNITRMDVIRSRFLQVIGLCDQLSNTHRISMMEEILEHNKNNSLLLSSEDEQFFDLAPEGAMEQCNASDFSKRGFDDFMRT